MGCDCKRIHTRTFFDGRTDFSAVGGEDKMCIVSSMCTNVISVKICESRFFPCGISKWFFCFFWCFCDAYW